MKSGSDSQLYVDAVTIRGILDLLTQDEPEPYLTARLVALTQHVSEDTAKRLLKILSQADIIERSRKDVEIPGARAKVPCLGWHLTAAARRGEIDFEGEQLARGGA
jgi:hypothetical protein